MEAFNAYQYADFLEKSRDLYANSKYQIILKYLSDCKDLDILNIGCGSGELSFEMARAGHRVLGIDPVPEYIRLASLNAARMGIHNCNFEISSIEDFSAEHTFDCVVATDVLEHIEDDRVAFQKMVRLVNPGGLVMITVPAGQWLFGYHDEALGHFRRYSKDSLLRLVNDFCCIEEMRYFGFSLIPVCCLYSKLLGKPYPFAAAGDSYKNSIVATGLRSLLWMDKLVPMPFGTSLIMKGIARKAA